MKLFLLLQFLIFVSYTVGVFTKQLSNYYHTNIIIMGIIGGIVGYIQTKYELKRK